MIEVPHLISDPMPPFRLPYSHLPGLLSSCVGRAAAAANAGRANASDVVDRLNALVREFNSIGEVVEGGAERWVIIRGDPSTSARQWDRWIDEVCRRIERLRLRLLAEWGKV